jgi:hypothetical protein
MAETCEVCGFEWDAIHASDVAPRLTSAAYGMGHVLGASEALVTQRPEPERWSALEYGAHVRDVMINVRDRIFVGLAEDNPVTKPMYRDLRIPFYRAETQSEVADELAMAVALFLRTFTALNDQQLGRPLMYAYPREASRSVLWVAAQALHEAEHHLGDARENVTALSAR